MTAEAGQDLLGRLGIPETGQDVQQHGTRPGQKQVWCIQALGEALGSAECSQRIGVPAAPELEPSAGVLHRQPRRGLRILCDSSLGALKPGLSLLRPAPPNQYGSEGQVRDARGRVFGPAVPPSQFDRLHAALGCPSGRPVELNSCLVCQVPQHTNVIEAAKTAGISRIVYTSMLNADRSTSPLAGEHRETERVLRDAAVPHTVLRNGYYTEGYADHLGEYLAAGEIIGAVGHGRMSTATRQDYATAAAAALLSDEARNRTYELGGAGYDVTGLAQLITDVTGTKVTYRDLSADEYAAELQRSGMDR